MCSCLLDQSQLHFLPVEVLYSKWLVIASYPRNLLNASQVSKELFLAESVHYLSVCVSLGLSWDGESVLECQDIWRGKWVTYCMVRLDRCRVVPTGQDKAGGGILLPKDGPGMCMCN